MYLYGASGHAKVIIDILRSRSIPVEGLIDDNLKINELLGYRVFHDWEGRVPLIISIGDNRLRYDLARKLNCEFGVAIDESAVVSPSTRIDVGSVVMQGAILQSEVIVGKHCIVNTGASLDHECVLENFVHISPGCRLCGNVFVGEGTWIGAGCVVIPGVRVGRWSIVGAGSVVTRDIPDGVLAYGNRCKIIKTLDMGVLANVKNGGKMPFP